MLVCFQLVLHDAEASPVEFTEQLMCCCAASFGGSLEMGDGCCGIVP
jgi:hypothetical protein